MKKTIGYLRVSTEEQTDGHSIDNQEAQVRMYCTLYNLDLIDIIKDEGISGRKTHNRPGFNRMMEMVKSKQIDHVVALSFTRFARNTMDTLSSIDTMIKHDVAFHSITEKITTDGAIGKFLITLFAGLSQFESDTIGDRTRSVKRFCKENGRTYTQPMLGYDNVFEIDSRGKRINGKLVVNEAEMEIVKEIFSLRSQDVSLNKIAQELNERGVPTKHNKRWHAVTIKTIIDNPIYLKVA